MSIIKIPKFITKLKLKLKPKTNDWIGSVCCNYPSKEEQIEFNELFESYRNILYPFLEGRLTEIALKAVWDLRRNQDNDNFISCARSYMAAIQYRDNLYELKNSDEVQESSSVLNRTKRLNDAFQTFTLPGILSLNEFSSINLGHEAIHKVFDSNSASLVSRCLCKSINMQMNRAERTISTFKSAISQHAFLIVSATSIESKFEDNVYNFFGIQNYLYKKLLDSFHLIFNMCFMLAHLILFLHLIFQRLLLVRLLCKQALP